MCIYHSPWVASSTFVSALYSEYQILTPRERSICCLLNSKGCSLRKNNLCWTPAVPVQSICALDSLCLWKQGAFHRHLLCQCSAVVSENAGWSSCIQHPAEVPKHGRAVWRAATALEPVPPLHVTFHYTCQLLACYSGFLANIGDYNSVWGFLVCYLSNPLSEIIVIWICFKSKKHRTFLGLGQSLSSKWLIKSL